MRVDYVPNTIRERGDAVIKSRLCCHCFVPIFGRSLTFSHRDMLVGRKSSFSRQNLNPTGE